MFIFVSHHPFVSFIINSLPYDDFDTISTIAAASVVIIIPSHLLLGGEVGGRELDNDRGTDRD